MKMSRGGTNQSAVAALVGAYLVIATPPTARTCATSPVIWRPEMSVYIIALTELVLNEIAPHSGDSSSPPLHSLDP